jgi:hypothetical protein
MMIMTFEVNLSCQEDDHWMVIWEDSFHSKGLLSRISYHYQIYKILSICLVCSKFLQQKRTLNVQHSTLQLTSEQSTRPSLTSAISIFHFLSFGQPTDSSQTSLSNSVREFFYDLPSLRQHNLNVFYNARISLSTHCKTPNISPHFLIPFSDPHFGISSSFSWRASKFSVSYWKQWCGHYGGTIMVRFKNPSKLKE